MEHSGRLPASLDGRCRTAGELGHSHCASSLPPNRSSRRAQVASPLVASSQGKAPNPRAAVANRVPG